MGERYPIQQIMPRQVEIHRQTWHNNTNKSNIIQNNKSNIIQNNDFSIQKYALLLADEKTRRCAYGSRFTIRLITFKC